MSLRSCAFAALVAGLSLGACGGTGETANDASTAAQRITRDFGREVLSQRDRMPLPDGATVLRLLTAYEQVTMRFTGRSVLGIDGLNAVDDGETETTWALNVNGIESDTAPGEYRVRPGDVIQWDYRDWYTLFDVRATVGAFPETFTRGQFGRRFPVVVECSRERSKACQTVRRTLRDAGVPAAGTRPPGPAPKAGDIRRAQILIGPWRHWRSRPWPARIDRGARHSGVFARFTTDGREIRLLDWDAQPVRSAGAGSGLVAAIRPTEEHLLWVVTGVDEEGVLRAARALSSAALRDAFALVVGRDGPMKVPLPRPNPDAPRERVTD